MSRPSEPFPDDTERGDRTMTPRSRWVICRRALRSLQFKASLLTVLFILIVTSSGWVLSLHATTSVCHESEATRTQEWAESVAVTASPSVASCDRESLVRMANDLVQKQGVAYVAFAEASGQMLASAEASAGLLSVMSSPDGRTLGQVPANRPEFGRHEASGVTFINAEVPIYAQSTPSQTGKTMSMIVGYLHFATDVSKTQSELEMIAAHLWRLAIGVVLLVIPCSLVAMRKVVAPLEELTKTTRSIASGAMDARANASSQDEIGELGRSFNEMADRLAKTQLELIQFNTELERRVHQRTRELEELAIRDPLTGLHNRRHFADEMVREFAAAQRYDSDLTCLMFDVDYFKPINDQFGHKVGDEVLVLLANAIVGELRGSDLAARFGGDEFVLLLPQTASSAAAALAERIVSSFRQETGKVFPDMAVTLSVGVASLKTTRAPSAEAIIQEADRAMYAAKHTGRNRTITSTEAVATG